MTDIFDEMTKEELVYWIRKNIYAGRRPRKSEILFYRWNKQSDEYLNRERRLLDASRAQEWGKKHDEYARAFNASNNAEDRLFLAGKIDKCCQELKKKMDAFRAIDKTRVRADRMYKQYEAEREKERQEVPASRHGTAYCIRVRESDVEQFIRANRDAADI